MIRQEERVQSGAADEEMVVLKGLRKVRLGSFSSFAGSPRVEAPLWVPEQKAHKHSVPSELVPLQQLSGESNCAFRIPHNWSRKRGASIGGSKS